MVKKLQVYETPAITVSFDPNVCRHSGVCLRTLPAVFDVARSRWVRPEAGAPDAVAAAIRKWPSGALQFYLRSSEDSVAAERLAERIRQNEIAMNEGNRE